MYGGFMKSCSRCGVEKEYDEFQVRRASRDGLTAACKSCLSDYDSSRLRDPKRMAARAAYQKTESGKLRHLEACSRWVEKNQVKRAAHILVGNRVAAGKIERLPCEVCGCVDVDAHHDDYSQPLSVRWLCVTHHNEWHRINGEGANAL